MNFAENLELMRKKWDKGFRIFGYLPRPHWIFNHPLFQTYKDAKVLRKHGRVYYAALIQANEKMFRPVAGDNIPGNPGVVLYCAGGAYETDPEALRGLASQLYHYKNTDEAPEEWKSIVAQITDEHSFSYHLPVENRKSTGVYYTPLMFFRQHLPKDRLIGPIFPIVAAPEHCKCIMVLPKRYWTKEMKRFYLSFQ